MLKDTLGKRILLTGIHGFTGRYLRELLKQQGDQVYGLIGHGAPENANEKFADITHLASLRRAIEEIQPERVVHLAAITSVEHQDLEQMYQVNLFGTLNLLQALYDAGCHPEKIIIASSANVYGNPAQERVDESICPRPVNHYANSKLAMEHMVGTWFDRFPIVITRPFNYTGPGQPPHFLIPKIVQHFRERKPAIKLGNVQVVRDFSDVRFVAECYRRLLEIPAAGEIFNICSGTGYSIQDVLQKMTDISGYTINVVEDPALMRAHEIEKLVGCHQKLLQAVGKISRLPLEKTLLDMYQ